MTAKIAIPICDRLLTSVERLNGVKSTWNKIDFNLALVLESIGLCHTSFYFRMIMNISDRMIETGITKFITDNEVLKFKKLPPEQSEPNVFSVDDLAFGFNIFLGFCGLSVAAFVVEVIFGIKKCRKNLSFGVLIKKLKYRTLKFAKVHRDEEHECLKCFEEQKLTQNLLKQFKVKESIEI